MALKFPAWPFKRAQQPTQEDTTTTSPNLKALTSETYQTHTGVISLEEATRRSSKAKGPQNLSMAWDGDYVGMPGGFRTRDGGTLSERDQKDTYYQAYINNPWVRACVQAISKRFTSGRWGLEEVEQGKGNQKNYDRLMQLFLYVNDDQDFKQLLRAIAEDLGIFGEAFVEIVNGPDGLPAQLHKIDCVTMSTQFDKHGMVTRYVQNLDKSTETQYFEPDQIIRWWFPDPRASKKALSPIECLKDSVYLYTSMVTWGEKFFKAGGKPVFSIEMGEDSNVDDAQRYIKFFKENYLGIQNAHVPPVFYGGSRLVEFGKGSVELDFLQSLAWCRDEVLAGYNVPLNVLGIQETAHLGGGSGESSNKIFIYNTVKPVEEIILETLNFRIAKKAFNIYDWVVTVSHADYRDDEQIAKINDMKIRNGSRLIDEIRQEEGRPAYPKGGATAFVVAGKDIMPVERLDEIADEQRQQAQLSLQGAQQAMAAQQQGQNDNQDDEEDEDEEPPKGKKKAQEYFLWDRARIVEASHTGVMVAFFLKSSEAGQLVLPGDVCSDGEPIDDLHVTLAYLGEEDDLQGDVEQLKQIIAHFAASAPTLQGKVSGIGRFTSVPDGQPTPVYASVDVPGLPEWRQALVQVLRAGDFPPDSAHGFTPHITLAYIDASAPMPIGKAPAVSLTFDQIWLAVGDARYAFPLDTTEEGTKTYGVAQQEAQNHQTRETSLAQTQQTSFSETSHQPYQTPYSDPSSQERGEASGEGTQSGQTSSHQTPSGQSASPYQANGAQTSVTQAQNAPQGTSARQKTPLEAHTQAFIQAFGQTPHQAFAPSETSREALSSQTQAALYPQTSHQTSHAPQNTQSSRETQKDNIEHWQDADETVQKALAGLRARGVRRLTWKGHMSACAECAQNDGKTVNLGERFPSGAYTIPNHNHCVCNVIDADTGQEYEWKVDTYVPLSKRREKSDE